jgi:hypothetical protein
MSYINIIICIKPDRFLETWPPIYRGQERPVRDRLRVSQVDHHVYSRYTSCLTDLTLEFIRRPIPPILSPSSRTFVELTLVTHSASVLAYSASFLIKYMFLCRHISVLTKHYCVTSAKDCSHILINFLKVQRVIFWDDRRHRCGQNACA